jgi:hypothetical protein
VGEVRRLVSLADQYGLRIIARLDRPPDWARPAGSIPTTPPSNFEDFGSFAAQVAARYRGRIQHYQVWNEPNLSREWGNGRIDPRAYAQLLRVTASSVRGANPDALIISAPLAQTLERSSTNLSEIAYLDALYAAGFQDSADIVMANAYGFGRAPEDAPGPDVLNFRRLELLRQVMVAHNDADTAIWVAEFG